MPKCERCRDLIKTSHAKYPVSKPNSKSNTAAFHMVLCKRCNETHTFLPDGQIVMWHEYHDYHRKNRSN